MLDAHLAERARAIARGEAAPVPLRAAATVVLLRDRPAGIEAYLLRRQTSMAFAAGMHVFPGGGVDPRDADSATGWSGPPAREWAARLGCDPPTARASVAAAVRETFEEAAVLLAGPDGGDVVADTTGADWEADRRALLDRSLALTDLLERRGLVLRSDLLAAWGHWVTPRFEERRYDTHFYVAALPAGQRTRHVSDEADRVRWVRPAQALAEADVGWLAMLPPTRITLEELTAYGSVAEVLAAAPAGEVTTWVPGWVDDGDAVRMLLPGEPGYPGDDPGVEP